MKVDIQVLSSDQVGDRKLRFLSIPLSNKIRSSSKRA